MSVQKSPAREMQGTEIAEWPGIKPLPLIARIFKGAGED